MSQDDKVCREVIEILRSTTRSRLDRQDREVLASKLESALCAPASAERAPDDRVDDGLRSAAVDAPASSERATNAALQEVEDALWTLHSYESNRDDAGRSYSEAEITKMVSAIRALAPNSAKLAQVPEGWALVPAELTAENGMKFHMSGDWSVRVDEEGHEVVIPWDTIKQIHRDIVERSQRLLARSEGRDA
jgi:hypothetical protein